MHTSDRWRLLTLAAHLWWLGVQTEWQRNRLQRAVGHGMALSDPALIRMTEPFQELCVAYWLVKRSYMQQRTALLSRHVQAGQTGQVS